MKVFISHINEEAQLARVLKEWIESSFVGNCEVFVSSDKDDIPAGSKWLEKIDKALETSTLLLVLCSPFSLLRPWINFETGCGWIKRVPIIPVCHSGQKKGKLPPPISMFQSLELEKDSFCAELISALAKHFGINKIPRIDQASMKRELLEAIGQAQQKSLRHNIQGQESSKLQKPDIKVKTSLGFISSPMGPRDMLIIEVQNHSSIVVFTGMIDIKLKNNMKLVLTTDSATGEMQKRRELRPGEKFSLRIFPEKLFENVKPDEMNNVVLTDDIDRKYESDLEQFQYVISELWDKYKKHNKSTHANA